MKTSTNIIPNIQPPAKFDPLGDKFNEWWNSVELYLRILGNSVSEDTKAAIVLSLFHPTTLQKLVSLAQNEKLNIFEIGFTALKKIIHSSLATDNPIFYERFVTFNLKQQTNSSIDDWATTVMQQTQKFEIEKFTLDDLQTLIFVTGLDNKELQKELLKQISSLHATKTVSLSFSAARRITKDQLAYNELYRKIHNVKNESESVYHIHDNNVNAHETVNTEGIMDNETTLFKITHKKDEIQRHTNERRDEHAQVSPPKPCWYCGGMHLNKDCPHRNKICHNCKKQGHLAKVCKNRKISQPVHAISKTVKNKRKFISLNLNQNKGKLQIDTASDISIISHTLWRLIGCPKINPTKFTANHAGNAPLKFIGECFIDVQTESHHLKGWKFYIHDNQMLNILGLDLFDKLGLGDTPLNRVHQVFKETKNISEIQTECNKLKTFIDKFPNVFTQGLGKCQYVKAELYLKENATPIFRQKRPVPLALREAVEKEIERLQKEGVLKPVNYSDWAAPIVTVRKPNGTIRLCADFSTGLNNMLKDIHYPLPTVEDIFSTFNGGIIFSKIDLSDAYLQIEVEEKSQNLLTIHTHKGLYQYTRLPFGIKSAPALFQQIMDQVLSGSPNKQNCVCQTSGKYQNNVSCRLPKMSV
jgi:hypothetical protein